MYLNQVGIDLGIEEISGWFNVKATDIKLRNGVGLLEMYSGSLALGRFFCTCTAFTILALSGVYPDYLLAQRSNFDRAKKMLNLDDASEWYRVTDDDLAQAGIGSIVRQHADSR
jgi:hypothetical protein